MPIILVHEPFWRGLLDRFRGSPVAEGMIAPKTPISCTWSASRRPWWTRSSTTNEKRGFEPSATEREVLLNL